ncbi:MAG TPA: carbohydrate ABC transporter permease [Jatrophihabitans sp.]
MLVKLTLKRVGGLAVVAALTLWTLAALLPIVSAVLASVKTTDAITASPLGIPANPTFDNFTRAWNGPLYGVPLWKTMINSAIAVSVGVGVGVSVGTVAGYALARNPRTLSWLNRYFVLLLTVPQIVIWVPLFSLASDLNVLSSPAALGLVYAALVIPLSTVLMRTYFASFPLDLIEAAKVDGASETYALARIVIPMSKGTIGLVALLQAIMLWNELALAVILLLEPDSQTIPLGLTQFRSQFEVELGPQFAGLVLAIVPMIMLYLIANRRIISGMRLGSLR